MTVMAETTFGVKYEGPALADGRMAVRDLAPALLALGELFTEASTTLYPDRPPVALDIHATRQGSFDVDLILTAAEGAWDAAELFGSDGLSTLINLKEIILGGSGGTISLIHFIKWLRGRRIKTVEDAPAEDEALEPGQVRVTVEDGKTSIEVPQEVLKLHKSLSVRTNAKEVVRPLEREGVDTFKATADSEVTVAVGKEDLPAFNAIEPPEEEEELQDTTRETTVQIVAIAWNEDNKWRFSEGGADASFYARIEDPAFWDGIDKGAEAFRKGDLLKCSLRTIQRKVDGRLEVEYQIVKVDAHIEVTQVRGEQLSIDSEDAESGGDLPALPE